MGERKETLTARKDYYRARQRCVSCGQQDAFTLIGKRLCADCTEKAAQQSKEYDREHRQERNAYKMEWTRKRKEMGLCRCGRPSEGGYARCARCRARENAQRRKNPLRDYSVCWTCKKNPVMDGKKLCRECWEQSCRNLEKAREAEKAMGANVWVKYYAKPKEDSSK